MKKNSDYIWYEDRGEIDSLIISKNTRNAVWSLYRLKSWKYIVFMNGETQRIFSSYDEAVTYFEIKTKSYF